MDLKQNEFLLEISSNFVEIEGNEDLIKKVALEIGFSLDKALTKPCDTLFAERRF